MTIPWQIPIGTLTQRPSVWPVRYEGRSHGPVRAGVQVGPLAGTRPGIVAQTELFLEECLVACLFLGQLLFHVGYFERVGIRLIGTK